MPKVILITGASSGIGAATARRLADAGHLIVTGARRTDRLAALGDEVRATGGVLNAYPLDVTDLGSVRAFAAAALDRHGRIDVLVNNAGVMPLSPIAELRIDELAEQGGSPEAQGAARAAAERLAIPASAIAEAIAFMVAQPSTVDVNELTARPTAQG